MAGKIMFPFIFVVSGFLTFILFFHISGGPLFLKGMPTNNEEDNNESENH